MSSDWRGLEPAFTSGEREAEERLGAEHDHWQLEEVSVWLQHGEDKGMRSLYNHKMGNPLLGLYWQ